MKNEFSFFTRPLINYQRLSQRLCGPTHYKDWSVFIIYLSSSHNTQFY